MTACRDWVVCPVGQFSEVAPSKILDRSCKACAAQTFTPKENMLRCTDWTVCKGAKDIPEGEVEEGVVVHGTPSSDVECERCPRATVSLLSDSYSPCFELEDQDHDGWPDRFHYQDRRKDDSHVHDEFYDATTEMDTRHRPASGGPPYDRCPFEPGNDLDDDGICAGVTPVNYRKLVEVGGLYLEGTWHTDFCPDDPTNDVDKDGICDDRDKQVTTWDFTSHNLVGWQEKACKEHSGCEQPAGWIKPTPTAAGEISPILRRNMRFDADVLHVCGSDTTHTAVVTKLDEAQTCGEWCEAHHLVCLGAVAAAEDPGVMCGDAVGDEKSCETETGAVAKCKCGPDPELVKTQQWTGHKLCPTCSASTEHDPAAQGSMLTEFKIKKNSLAFLVKGAFGAGRHVSLTIKNLEAVSMAKATKGMPTIKEMPSATDAQWYPVEWDLSKHVGDVAILEVTDGDPNNGISVDHFEWYNDGAGCLPACMKIKDSTCDGETCFYFENDPTPYTVLQKTGSNSGMYCRNVPYGSSGSPIGPGVTQMCKEGAKSGKVCARVDHLASNVLPRCLHIELRGSHHAIRIADKTLGDGEVPIDFAYSPQDKRMGLEGTMCVYPTLKPRCVDYSKPAAAFRQQKIAVCKGTQYEQTCFDQCYSIHCSAAELQRAGACGKSKAFQDCAQCCGGNNNEASGCFRRRRRLGAAVAMHTHSKKDQLSLTQNQCAERCLNTWGCIGFDMSTGSCAITSQCGYTKADAASGGFSHGGWRLLASIKRKDLVEPKPAKAPKPPGVKKMKKRRRKIN